MMRIATLSLASLLAPMALFGQITIGQNEMPHAGDELVRTRANTNPFLNYAATGPAHLWDFADLAAADQEATAYQSVTSTNIVYAIAYADIFFNPNRANVARPGVDIAFNELLPIQDPFTFTYRSSSTYRTIGFGADLSGIPVPIVFDEPDEIYHLPLQYGDATSTSSAWKVSIPTLAYYGYAQQRTNEVDGWGTITTPAGSFEVLRVKTTLEGRDSINVDTLGLGFAIERPIVREYKWLAQDLRVPVLQINTAEVFGLEVITEIYFYDAPRTLAVVPPLSSVLCAGSTVQVPFDATGAFNQGILFVPNNVFRAQLSDANGDFTNAVNIGSLNGTVSGTITATIPANTPVGSAYRIRVIATSPGFTGTDNGTDLTVDVAPTAAITVDGEPSFCAGSSVALNANAGSGLTYVWSLDGNTIDGAAGAQLDAAAAGDYRVRVANACGTTLSAPVTLSVLPAPEHVLQADIDLFMCMDSLVTLTAENLSSEAVTYRWFHDGNELFGEASAMLLTTEPGTYAIEATSATTGCAYTATRTLQLDPVSASTPAVQPANDTAFCEGGSIQLLVEAPAGVQQQWYMNGSAILGANGDQLSVTNDGMYTVVLTSALGCPSRPSDGVSVSVVPLPSQPMITQAGSGLSASGSGTFQWYFNGTALPDATGPEIEALVNGDYTVAVTNAFGCSTTSSVYTYISTGIDGVTSETIGVAPNPSTGRFTVSVAGGGTTPFIITDATGRNVQQGRLSGPNTVVDLSGRPSGAYILRMTDSGHTVRLLLD